MKHIILSGTSLLLIFICANSLAAPAAKSSRGGGFFIDETFIPVYVNKNETTTYNTSPGVATESGFGYDLRTTLGYVFQSQILVGFTYNMYKLSTQRAAVDGGDEGLTETTNRTEMGPTLGYINSGWRVLFTYFLSGNKQVDKLYKDSTGTTTGDLTFKNTQLSGFQFTLGYSFALSSSFEIGPSLVYKNLTYAKQSKTNRLTPAEDYAESELFTKAVDNSLSPMISMSFKF